MLGPTLLAPPPLGLFNLHSRRQFCSRFVHEVVEESIGERLGQVQTLAGLLAQHPQARTGFWRAWYLGSTPGRDRPSPRPACC